MSDIRAVDTVTAYRLLARYSTQGPFTLKMDGVHLLTHQMLHDDFWVRATVFLSVEGDELPVVIGLDIPIGLWNDLETVEAYAKRNNLYAEDE